MNNKQRTIAIIGAILILLSFTLCSLVSLAPDISGVTKISTPQEPLMLVIPVSSSISRCRVSANSEKLSFAITCRMLICLSSTRSPSCKPASISRTLD